MRRACLRFEAELGQNNLTWSYHELSTRVTSNICGQPGKASEPRGRLSDACMRGQWQAEGGTGTPGNLTPRIWHLLPFLPSIDVSMLSFLPSIFICLLFQEAFHDDRRNISFSTLYSKLVLTYFKIFHLFTYLGCVGSWLLLGPFSSRSEQRRLCSCIARASHWMASPVLGHRL